MGARLSLGVLEMLELLGTRSRISWPTWLALVLLPSESTVTAAGLEEAIDPDDDCRSRVDSEVFE